MHKNGDGSTKTGNTTKQNFKSLHKFSCTTEVWHRVRAVKEIDSKSIGFIPRRFESCRCRFLTVTSILESLCKPFNTKTMMVALKPFGVTPLSFSLVSLRSWQKLNTFLSKKCGQGQSLNFLWVTHMRTNQREWPFLKKPCQRIVLMNIEWLIVLHPKDNWNVHFAHHLGVCNTKVQCLPRQTNTPVQNKLAGTQKNRWTTKPKCHWVHKSLSRLKRNNAVNKTGARFPVRKMSGSRLLSTLAMPPWVNFFSVHVNCTQQHMIWWCTCNVRTLNSTELHSLVKIAFLITPSKSMWTNQHGIPSVCTCSPSKPPITPPWMSVPTLSHWLPLSFCVSCVWLHWCVFALIAMLSALAVASALHKQNCNWSTWQHIWQMVTWIWSHLPNTHMHNGIFVWNVSQRVVPNCATTRPHIANIAFVLLVQFCFSLATCLIHCLCKTQLLSFLLCSGELKDVSFCP